MYRLDLNTRYCKENLVKSVLWQHS